MLNTPFPPWPSYSQEESEAIKNVLLSNKVNYWTGEETRQFENEFAQYTHCKYAVALANGTVALDLALKALGVGQGDEVIVTPRSFIASVSCVVNAGAKPVFADVDSNSQNIEAETIEPVITKRTKAIIVVHLAGMPADMDPITELASQHQIYVIEDCAQAHGAEYKGRPVGSIGHIGAWSFCQDKIMTTGGEGGIVTTNCDELWARMWSYKDHGKSWEAINSKKQTTGFRWVHDSFGTNWRMTEIQATLGRIQLRKMPVWRNARFSNAKAIWASCQHIEWLRIPNVGPEFTHAAYKAYMFVMNEHLPATWSRDRILCLLNDMGVPAFSGSCSEIYLEKAFDGTDYRPPKRLTSAKKLGETSLMLLVHPTLKKAHIDRTINAIEDVNKKIISR